MTEIEQLTIADNVRYAQDHEWAKLEGDKIKIGISDYAQDQLGDVVFVELPQIGNKIKKGEEFGTVESVKAVSELYMPVSGEVISINSKLEESPELVNKSPYDDGWMIEIKPDDLSELDALMNKEEYIKMLKGMED